MTASLQSLILSARLPKNLSTDSKSRKNALVGVASGKIANFTALKLVPSPPPAGSAAIPVADIMSLVQTQEASIEQFGSLALLQSATTGNTVAGIEAGVQKDPKYSDASTQRRASYLVC